MRMLSWFRRSLVAQAISGGVLSLALFVAGVMLVFGGQDWRTGPPPAPSLEAIEAGDLPIAADPAAPGAPGASAEIGAGDSSPGVRMLPRSRPTRLDIPAIGVRTSLMQLGLEEDGTIAVPPLGRDEPAGWYRYLSAPGERGPAVILGHVDSAREGPAVFFRLGELAPGDQFTVDRADGWRAHFTVRRIGVYQKTEFPSDAVYGQVGGAEVRLVTCGGPFDRSTRHYRDNIVVFAALTSTSRT